MPSKNISLLCLPEGEFFGQRLARKLKIDQHLIQTKKFSNDNIEVNIPESFASDEILLVQTSVSPVSDRIVEMLLAIEALRYRNVKKIYLVSPYLFYSRSDKPEKNTGIALRAIAEALQGVGLSGVFTFDIHSLQGAGHFSVPVIVSSTTDCLVKAAKGIGEENLLVVAPDIGAYKRAKEFASFLNCDVSVIYKKRFKNAEGIERSELLGDAAGLNAFIVDDEFDTGGSQIAAAEELKSRGAMRIFGFYSHGVFSGDSVERINNSPIEKVYVTDSFRGTPPKGSSKIKIVSAIDSIASSIQNFFNLKDTN